MLMMPMLRTMSLGFALRIVYFITVAHAAQPMTLGDFSCVNSLDDASALELTNGRVRINNFTISEDKSWVAKNVVVLNFSASGSNRTEKSVNLSVEAVGYDPANAITFVVTAHPLFSTISAGKTEVIKGDIYAAPATLTHTSRFCIRVTGEF